MRAYCYKKIVTVYAVLMLCLSMMFSSSLVTAYAKGEEAGESATQETEAEEVSDTQSQEDDNASAESLQEEQNTEGAAAEEAAPAEQTEESVAAAQEENAASKPQETSQAPEQQEQESATPQPEESAPAAEESAKPEDAQEESKAEPESTAAEAPADMYTYTFNILSHYDEISVKIGYAKDVNEDGVVDEPKLILVSPSGNMQVEIPKGENVIENQEVRVAIEREYAIIRLKVDKASIGTWLVKSEYPVSFIIEEAPVEEPIEEPVVEPVAETSTIEEIINFLSLNAVPIIGLVLLVGAFVAFIVINKKIKYKDKNNNTGEPAYNKKDKKKTKTNEPEIPDDGLTPEERQKAEIEKIKKELTDKYLDPKLYQQPAEKVAKEAEAKKKAADEPVFVTKEDLENDETIESLYDEGEIKEQTRTKNTTTTRKSFFPDDRFED